MIETQELKAYQGWDIDPSIPFRFKCFIRLVQFTLGYEDEVCSCQYEFQIDL